MKSMSSGLLSRERRLDAGEQLHRAEVDVLVEAEAEVEEQLAFEDAGLHVGMADGAEEDAVELAELVEAVGGQGFAGFEIAVAAPVEVGELEVAVEAFELGDGLEDLDAFGGDLGAGAVAADDCDVHGIVRGQLSVVSWRELGETALTCSWAGAVKGRKRADRCWEGCEPGRERRG